MQIERKNNFLSGYFNVSFLKKTFKTFFYLAVIFLFVFLIVNQKAFAAVGDVQSIINLFKNPGNNTSPYALLDLGESIIKGISGLNLMPLFALLVIIYAGLMYIFAGGDPKKTENAVKLLNSAVIGFALLLMFDALWGFISKIVAP